MSNRETLSEDLRAYAREAERLSNDLVAAAKDWAVRNALFQNTRADVKDAEAALEDEQNIFIAVLEAEYAAAKADKGPARLTASTADGRKAQTEELLIKERAMDGHLLHKLSRAFYAAKEKLLRADIDLATSRAALDALQSVVALHVKRFELLNLATAIDERALAAQLELIAPKEGK